MHAPQVSEAGQSCVIFLNQENCTLFMRLYVAKKGHVFHPSSLSKTARFSENLNTISDKRPEIETSTLQ